MFSPSTYSVTSKMYPLHLEGAHHCFSSLAFNYLPISLAPLPAADTKPVLTLLVMATESDLLWFYSHLLEPLEAYHRVIQYMHCGNLINEATPQAPTKQVLLVTIVHKL